MANHYKEPAKYGPKRILPDSKPSITDEEIIRLYKSGKFIKEICHTYSVGLVRVRNAIRNDAIARSSQ